MGKSFTLNKNKVLEKSGFILQKRLTGCNKVSVWLNAPHSNFYGLTPFCLIFYCFQSNPIKPAIKQQALKCLKLRRIGNVQWILVWAHRLVLSYNPNFRSKVVKYSFRETKLAEKIYKSVGIEICWEQPSQKVEVRPYNSVNPWLNAN